MADPTLRPGTPERRQLTVLFTDLCGSTELGRTLEMETYADLLERVRQVWREAARRYGGLVLRTQGDGAMMVFGYPLPGESDGRQAADAALEIHRQLGELPLPPEAGLTQLRARSGIHAGVALVAPGDLERGRFDLVGDVANTAAKLEQAAAPGQILASLPAVGPHAGLFTHEPVTTRDGLGAIAISGRSGLARRIEATTRRGLTPLLGRLAPLQALADFIADPGARCLVVTAPAGHGKTRLLDEWRTRTAHWPGLWLSGTCEQFQDAEALQPFTQMLRRLPPAAGPGAQGTPPAAQAEALLATFEQLCRQQPVLMVLDDWQWADDASRLLLQGLLDLPAGPRIVLAARPQADGAPWVAQVPVVALAPLDAPDSARAVQGWLPDADPFLVRRIHGYSGGVPLYIEELCHAATAANLARLLEGHDASPQSWLKALVTTRLARLDDGTARLVRTAAVIGNEVPGWLLGVAAGEPLSPTTLQRLADTDFLVVADAATGLLRFRHGVSRDAVYESIGLQARRQLHECVHDALRAQPGPPDWVALARHSRGAGRWAEAAASAEQAGDQALAASAMDNARAQYQAALAALDRQPTTDPSALRRWCAVAAKLGMTCVFDPLSLGGDTRHFERAVALAGTLGDLALQARARYWLGYILYGLGRYRDALHQAQQGLALARQAEDAALATQIEAMLGQILAGCCAYDEALQRLAAAIEAKRQRARPGSGVAIGSAYALACEGAIHADRGAFGTAGARFDEALRLLGTTRHPVGNSVRNWVAVAAIWQGDWPTAQRIAVDSVRIAETTRALLLLAVSRSTLGYARWCEDGRRESLQLLDDAVSWMAARRGQMFTSLHFGWLAEALAAVGETARCRTLAAHVLRRARDGERLGEATVCRTLALLAARAGHAARAQRWLARADASAQARGSAREAALNRLAQARVQGDGAAMAAALSALGQAGVRLPRRSLLAGEQA